MVAPKINPTAASILGFLEDGEQTGYGLARTAEELIGDFWSITRSQLYRELAALCERDLIESAGVGPRSARPYRLTSAGHKAFLAWLATPAPPEHIRFPLLLTLSFGRWLDPDQERAMLVEHRQMHAERLARYQTTGELADPHLAAVLSFGIHYERAVLEWLDTLSPALLR